jgi:urease accessory protein UreE
MTVWQTLLTVVGVRQVSMREIRAEAFFLGNRHKGEIVEGARKELRAPDLDPDRAALLRAVIRMAPVVAAEGSRP